jgi:glutaconate CoA-transferase subunit A
MLTTLSEAAKLVRPGDMLALGGTTLYRRPVAFVRELLRQGTDRLTLLELTAGFESDLLVGAGRVTCVRTCYFGLEAFGLAPMFTKLAGRGAFSIMEETEGSIAFGLRATEALVGFMAGRAWLGTDMFKARPDVRMVQDPYSGEMLPAFPAIRPDVAVIHVPVADREGNAAVYINKAYDRELGLTADRLIVTAERIVDSFQELKSEIDILGRRVSALVQAPGGARPTSCYPDYPLDSMAIMDYIEACNRGEFDSYLERFLRGSNEPAGGAA